MKKGEKGFTLIEVIVTLVLSGVVAAFAGLFMTTFLNSYFFAKTNSESALKAQVALDRISLELKSMRSVTTFTNDSLVTYTRFVSEGSVATVDRTLQFVAPRIYLGNAGVAGNVLIDNVQSLTLRHTDDNLDNVAGNEVAFIDVSFRITGITTPFSARILPRHLVPAP
jgi:prepilin-type N-terminal cleavage/methylation domain-containing protein